jgi:hypothetical protein
VYELPEKLFVYLDCCEAKGYASLEDVPTDAHLVGTYERKSIEALVVERKLVDPSTIPDDDIPF